MVINHENKNAPLWRKERLALDFDLSTQFDNPVWRDLN